jgi:inhibitor of KinA sporulation pathway (predicted exonuclease)
MHYIVFDQEFNQDYSLVNTRPEKGAPCPFEIIQIGAIKLDADLKPIATFGRYIKPIIYAKISPFITELTGITTKHVEQEEHFPVVYDAFIDFIGGRDAIFCAWGKTDMKELYRNVSYHQLNDKLLPKQFINVQPYASLHFGLPQNHLLKLQSTVEALEIPITFPFHDALHDAHYTAEVFKKIYSPSMQTVIYDPIYINTTASFRKSKRAINFEALYGQFEKMYNRPLTEEELGMIKLAYQMGKTNQFLV